MPQKDQLFKSSVNIECYWIILIINIVRNLFFHECSFECRSTNMMNTKVWVNFRAVIMVYWISRCCTSLTIFDYSKNDGSKLGMVANDLFSNNFDGIDQFDFSQSKYWWPMHSLNLWILAIQAIPKCCTSCPWYSFLREWWISSCSDP